MKKLFGLALIVGLLLSLAACTTTGTTYIKDAYTMNGAKITDVYKVSKGKKNKHEYNYYLKAYKAGNTYKMEIKDEVIYDEIDKIQFSNPNKLYDIMYSQEIYGEKDVIGIAYTSHRR